MSNNTVKSTTLSKHITSTFFATNSGYDEMRRRWSAAVNDKSVRKTLTAQHHMLYLILSGKDLSKSFTPITKQIKLDNGARPFGNIEQAMNLYSYDLQTRQYVFRANVVEMFKDLLSPEAPSLIFAMRPKVADGDFQYCVPASFFEEIK